jgi:hypothetical protein
MLNLNDCIPPDSGWALQQAWSINRDGDITGFGVYSGQTRGFCSRLRCEWSRTRPRRLL